MRAQYLIVTVDDFGLHVSVNEAVERASRAGTVSAASLMMGAPATADAVRRARKLTELRVGLHLVLADGRALCAPHTVPALCGPDGQMSADMGWKSLRFFLQRSARRQLESEIRAQFLAFADTGLVLDHLNVHKHLHLHPTVLGIILRVAGDFGVPAMRLPLEPLWFVRDHAGWTGMAAAMLLAPWAAVLKRRLRAANMPHNDQVFGLAASGAMDEAALLSILARLPEGVSEIYLHPAVFSGTEIAESMRGYRHADELAALMSPRVRGALSAAGVPRGGFRDALRQVSAT